MAIVRSLGVGEGKKSAGMLTYRSVRGRTIASRRVITNASNTAAQASQRGVFGNATKFMMFILGYIEIAFEKSRYGSARNNYVKSNPNLKAWGGQQLLGEVQEGVVSIGDALVASNIGLVSTSDAGIQYVSRGTAGGVQVIPKEKWPNTSYWGETEEIGVNSIYKGMEFVFPTGAIPSDVTVDIFQFPRKTTEAAEHISFVLNAEGQEETPIQYGFDAVFDEKGLCTACRLDTEFAAAQYDAVIIPVIRYRGKVVSNNVMVAICDKDKAAASASV